MGTFTIKKKNIKRFSIAAVVVSILAIIGISTYVEQRNNQREIDAYFRTIKRATEREYEGLKREYESYIETINDYDYSYDFRYRYVVKVNRLLEQNVYETGGREYNIVSNFLNTQPTRKSKDLEILKRIASRKVFED